MIPNLVTIAGDIPTNTRRTKTYDHILIDRNMTREYAGRFGVIDFQRDLGLTEKQALLISDHMPLWAEFSAYEASQVQPVASAALTVRPSASNISSTIDVMSLYMAFLL